MNVLIDGFWIDKPRGLGTYVRTLVDSLSFCNKGRLNIYVLVPDGKVPKNMSSEVKFITSRSVPYPIWENFVIPMVVKRIKADVLHCPYNTAPFFNLNCKKIITVHDLIFMNYSGAGLYQKLGNLYRKISLKRALNFNPEIITVSNLSAREIKNKIGIDAAYVYTPFSSSSNFDRASKKNIDGDYFIHVGGDAPHKNTEMVINAFIDSGFSGQLVVIGMSDQSPIANRYRSTKIHFPGWISETEKNSFYANAVGVIFPSLAEGYGLPIIEGFFFGVPVITSNFDPMAEIAFDAALLVDPSDKQQISRAIRQLAEEPSLRNELIGKGHERLKVFDFEFFGEFFIRKYLQGMSS